MWKKIINTILFIKNKISRHCSYCHKPMSLFERRQHTYNHETICIDCAVTHFIWCSQCHSPTLESEIISHNGLSYCPNCNEEYNNGNLKFRELLGYHQFNYDEDLNFFSNDNIENPLYLGVELEVDNKDDCNNSSFHTKMIHAVSDILPEHFVHFEHDGSIHNGFEIITQPATLKYHTSIKEQYQTAFKKLINKKYRSHQTSTCGLHIHINKSYFAENEDFYTARLISLFDKFWSELVKFSRRSKSKLSEWARRLDGTPEDIVHLAKDGSIGRYHALNLTNCDTLEFRLFKGTLKLQTYIATLQLVDTMVRKCRELSDEEFEKLTWEDLLIYDEIKAYWNTLKEKEKQ